MPPSHNDKTSRASSLVVRLHGALHLCMLHPTHSKDVCTSSVCFLHVAIERCGRAEHGVDACSMNVSLRVRTWHGIVMTYSLSCDLLSLVEEEYDWHPKQIQSCKEEICPALQVREHDGVDEYSPAHS